MYLKFFTFFFITCLATTSPLEAQERADGVLDLLTVNLFMPGLSYEKRISPKQSFKATVGSSIAFSYLYSLNLGDEFHLFVDPEVDLQYRYYYNFGQRYRSGKQTSQNSANYLSSGFNASLSKMPANPGFTIQENHRPLYLAYVISGMQRNFRNRLSLDLAVGAGYLFAKDTYNNGGTTEQQRGGDFHIVTRITLGIWLGKKPI